MCCSKMIADLRILPQREIWNVIWNFVLDHTGARISSEGFYLTMLTADIHCSSYTSQAQYMFYVMFLESKINKCVFIINIVIFTVYGCHLYKGWKHFEQRACPVYLVCKKILCVVSFIWENWWLLLNRGLSKGKGLLNSNHWSVVAQEPAFNAEFARQSNK